MEKKDHLIFIVGPTAVGKTEVAMELAYLLKKVEIVSCDSMAIYREMNIGIAKPPLEFRNKFPHWMIDIRSVKEEFNVFDYVKEARKVIAEIIARNNIPLIVGGSSLYYFSLVDGIFETSSSGNEWRQKLENLSAEKGIDFLYEKLKKVDPLSANKIHPNDKRRIIRALEVYFITGKRLSELKSKRQSLSGKYDIIIYGLERDRVFLYKRINERVDSMMQKGLLDEVRNLYFQGLSKTAYQAHGYKELIAFIKGEYDLKEAIRLIKRNTRRHAKRQLSWLKHDKRITWINLDVFDSPQDVANYIYKQLIQRGILS